MLFVYRFTASLVPDCHFVAPVDGCSRNLKTYNCCYHDLCIIVYKDDGILLLLHVKPQSTKDSTTKNKQHLKISRFYAEVVGRQLLCILIQKFCFLSIIMYRLT